VEAEEHRNSRHAQDAERLAAAAQSAVSAAVAQAVSEEDLAEGVSAEALDPVLAGLATPLLAEVVVAAEAVLAADTAAGWAELFQGHQITDHRVVAVVDRPRSSIIRSK
jgi:hypothetical protein